MSSAPPKYSLPEYERRWRVGALPTDLDCENSRLLEDWYLDGARLRLRRESLGEGRPTVWKLAKKYGEPRDYTQAMTNLYLHPEEWSVLRALPGCGVTKRRYSVSGAGDLKLDVFECPLESLLIAEFENLDLAVVRAFMPPAWVGEEITGRPEWSGAALARVGPPR